MDPFIKFRDDVNTRIQQLLSTNNVFRVELNHKDELWDAYLNSFAPEHNPLYETKTEHDCNCCKSFIRNIGTLISINKKYEYETIWDIQVDPIYKASVKAMKNIVLNRPIKNVYLNKEHKLGNKENYKLGNEFTIQFNHFYCHLPIKFSGNYIEKRLGEKNTNFNVLKRGLNTITVDSLETIIELIESKSLYRGNEFLEAVSKFLELKKLFIRVEPIKQDNFIWFSLNKVKSLTKFRNTVIGTLATDLSDNVDLNTAVGSFESKVAPSNYKRSSSLVTKAMKERAEQTAIELGVVSALQRRCAVVDDISINDVIYANEAVKRKLSLFDEVLKDIPDRVPDLNKLPEVSIDHFINNIVPNADNIELYVQNSLESNLMTLVAPVHADAPNILAWDNNFSWAYTGDITDSMKERVKAKGGKVDGVLRFSLQWNEDKNADREIDLDAHCMTPVQKIYYSRKYDSITKGKLDVDIITPGDKVAVENITWPNLRFLRKGVYEFSVHNYGRAMCTKGFKAEIEFNNNVYEFNYNKPIRGNETIEVASVSVNSNKEFSIETYIDNNSSVKNIWNIETNKFHKVNLIMNSPNHWKGNNKGNKHLFFILDQCINPKPIRGFFNEYLRPKLYEHRKVFEVLGSKMKAEPSNDQLSGLGFSDTQRNSVIFKVTGKTNKVIKVNM